MNKWKSVALIEAAIIIILLVMYFSAPNQEKTNGYKVHNGLLSQRIYAEVLPPESHLIFNFKPLEDSLEKYISQKNETIGVYITNLRDGASLGINEKRGFEPASLNKLPLAILVLKEIEKGALNFSTKLPITFEDADSDSGMLYLSVGNTITVDELLTAMLSGSGQRLG